MSPGSRCGAWPTLGTTQEKGVMWVRLSHRALCLSWAPTLICWSHQCPEGSLPESLGLPGASWPWPPPRGLGGCICNNWRTLTGCQQRSPVRLGTRDCPSSSVTHKQQGVRGTAWHSGAQPDPTCMHTTQHTTTSHGPAQAQHHTTQHMTTSTRPSTRPPSTASPRPQKECGTGVGLAGLEGRGGSHPGWRATQESWLL